MDRDAILDLIDQLRVAIPEEVRAAKRINAEGERILEKAEEEAERIKSRAQEQAAFLIGERGLLDLADIESRRIVAEADSLAADTRAGADGYALEMLETLEAEVGKALAGVQRGIAVLDDRRAELAAREPAPDDEPDEDAYPAGDLPTPDDGVGEDDGPAYR